MCENLVTTKTYRGCPDSCNTTTTVLNMCPTAIASGTPCANPKEKSMGQTTSRARCPLHVDEGYEGYGNH
ncbi:hypothetical protein BKA61DRAFT_152473 [Leptodontidium sp. MPI-SDFR-AT-0119]|nr:hypothetical protein BKA61DRAFT_152473 [Leptodontidium sp. MPI-SDFR-AT-0119]